jgi:Putative prokaryotic signal transducing protein
MASAMHSDRWEWLEDCADHLAAEVIAGQLRAESVPVYIQDVSAIPGLVGSSRIFVPENFMHRARWVLAQAPLSEAELEWLALAPSPAPAE